MKSSLDTPKHFNRRQGTYHPLQQLKREKGDRRSVFKETFKLNINKHLAMPFNSMTKTVWSITKKD